MNARRIYETWAPPQAQWTNFARVVPFIALNKTDKTRSISNLTIPKIYFLDKLQTDTALILDLHGNDGVEEGIAFARLGYRPVPLYNGCSEQDGAMALVDNEIIEDALFLGAAELQNINIPDNAPPVFLLDCGRDQKYKMSVSVFDNGWDVFPQDFPSGANLISSGIKKIIIRSDRIRKDLAAVLYKFQKDGLEIYFTDGFMPPQKKTIKKVR